MNVTIKSGLVALVHGVREHFAEYEVTAHVSAGWRERTKQINQGPGSANRVVFSPSDDGGRGGRLAGAHQPGPRALGTPVEGTIRSLATWERIVIVSIWAVDMANPHDEEKQIEAVETLFEHTVRAVQHVAYATAQWGDASWTPTPVEHMFGRELRVGLTLRHPIYDVPIPIAYPAPVIVKDLRNGT